METGNEAIIEAVREHAAKVEEKAAADRAEIKSLKTANREQADRLGALEQEFVAVRDYKGGRSTRNTAPDIAHKFCESEQFKGMQAGANSTGRVTLETGGLKLLTKAIIANAGRGAAGSNDYSVPADRWGGLGNNPQPTLSLLDILPSLPVASGSFEYMQLSGYTNGAAVQSSEGTAKAEADIATAVQTAYIATIAHHVPASLQVLNDAPALAGQLNNLMAYGARAKLESELINGSGTGKNIKGLKTGATAFVATSTDAQDKIGEAITELQANGWQPSAVLMNPKDWGSIQRARGETEKGYLLGSPRDPAPPSLWAVPVILSASLAQGTAIVLDASQCALLDREQVTVAMSREHAENFTENLVEILAELRAGLAVFSTGAVLSVDIGTGS